VRDIAAISDGFYDGECNAPDPRPELVQEARKGRKAKAQTQVAELAPANDIDTSATAATATANGPTGADIAERAIEQARKEDPPRRALGAAGMLGGVAQGAAKAGAAKAATSPPATSPSKTQPAVTLINPKKSQAVATAATGSVPTPPTAKPDMSKTAAKTATAKAETTKRAAATVAKADAAPGTASKGNAAKGAEIQTASVAGTATQLKVPSAPKAGTCKVWTASYGGQRAVLIKATAKGTVNYTVLDVNEANEKREVDAYIAAYAKGGQRVAAFPNQTQALDKAFALCPEG
jgi:hypothetical protein